MEELIKIYRELLAEIRTLVQGSNPENKYVDEAPLRAELFSSDQMDHHSISLAKSHKLSAKSQKDRLLIRLADNEKILLQVRHLLAKSVKESVQITPAGEWLLDNFYLIEEQIRMAKKHLPRVYSENLPQLSEGNSAGLPRVYDIVLEIISHSDGRIDMQSVSNFLRSYGTVTDLKLGELWAVPIMLRLALIENMRRVSVSIAIDRTHRNLAEYWAHLLIDTASNDPKNLILVIADMARSNPPLERAFVAELTRQLRGKGPTLAQALTWLEERLSENGQTSNELVQAENQKQAADQVSVSNSINSLRLLGSMDWRKFVETYSAVEQILLEDSIYPKMDFSTRDNYRHAIERIARHSDFSESEVARVAIQLAKENKAKGTSDDRTLHVGFYLIGPGLLMTEGLTKMKLTLREKIRRWYGKFPLLFYIGSIVLISLLVSMGILFELYSQTHAYWLHILIGVLAFICASQFAVSLVNFITTLLVRPDLLPRMDFSEGIPEDFRTLIVVPTLLSGVGEIEDLIESLEVHYLANKNANLHFGLVTDFKDADQQELPEDATLLQLTQRRIEELNEKYSGERVDVFFLFHRPRLFNPAEGKWMGHERKRGKLSDLNGLLRGESKECFSLIVGDQTHLCRVRYVITLDTDTNMPRESAWKIIGTIAHPLNRALYDERKQRVTQGYGILQPRVSVSLPGISSSIYARMNGNEPGIDPYTRATSDVYQDLFGEGSFIGKGIYDVDMFEKALRGKLPENRILSHDLLEGCYARSGLLSDAQFYEKYPGSYASDMKRRYRWIRGDWQIWVWVLPFVKDANKKWCKNPLSALSRWKIFDNIRRSIVPIAFTAFILLSWTLLPAAAAWTLIVTGIIIIPSIIVAIVDLFRKPKDVILSHHIILSSRAAGDAAVRTLFLAVCLPYEAIKNSEAIIRTWWRMNISHKHLLEWTAFGSKEQGSSGSLLASYLSMWIEPFIALAILIYEIVYSPITLLVAGPIILLWLLAPAVTWYVSLPRAKKLTALTIQETIFLQKQARKIWAFFEHLVRDEDNWLPPDNIQEIPTEIIAHRTSPTNIGLLLLANLSAYDFGYINIRQLLDRSEKTIASMHKLECFRGHFYNWYDTQTMQPLLPRYISTVDSGNLAGHLLTFRMGIVSLPEQKILGSNWDESISTTLRLLADTVNKEDIVKLRNLGADIEAALPDKLNPFTIKLCLDKLSDNYAAIIEGIADDETSDVRIWKEKLRDQIKDTRDYLFELMPWVQVSNVPGRFKDISVLMTLPTLLELSNIQDTIREEIKQIDVQGITDTESAWLKVFEASVAEAGRRAGQHIAAINAMTYDCAELADMEWDFLYDKGKSLLAIGYNVDEHRCDQSSYDLLASEARLTVFLGIAQGKLPQESWFALGRLLTNIDGNPTLLSWSGSMFEYLMPLLVMPSYLNTLLDQTDKEAVERQIDYGKQQGVPWGISESCYNLTDASQNYQYHAFGVPGMGLKRGLGEDLVVAPYASALALMVAPERACHNMQLLSSLGFEGRYGLYEAIDYTPSRLPPGQDNFLIRTFMAHHQGMSFLSLSYLLLNQPMQKRFKAEPQFQATLLLLQERIPKASSFYVHTTEIADIHSTYNEPELRIIRTPDTPIPAVQLLSNGNYHVMVTNAGGGYSRWKNIAVTRWSEDTTRDNWGAFCYIRDLQSGSFWSLAYQPSLRKVQNYEASFSQGRADFSGMYNNLETRTEIVVSPEDDIEMRRIHITNRSGKRRILDVTSYAEVVITPAPEDAAHPAFSNLFVQTEILAQQHAILCTRRPKNTGDKMPWMFHLMKVAGLPANEISYETDRMKFIGRGNTVVNPKAMQSPGALSGNQGSVLDPIVSIRYEIILEADQSVILDMIIGVGETREVCQYLIDKYQDKHNQDRVFELAWTHSQVVLRQINASEADAQLYSRLAGSVIYMNPAHRGEAAILIKNQRGQPGLWPYSISGDLPIVLVKIEDEANIEIVRQLVQAHAFWRLKGLAVDLVIWNESHGGYRQGLQNQIAGLIANQSAEQPGGIFVRNAEQISNEDRILFHTVARIVIADSGGTLADHNNRKLPPKTIIPAIIPAQTFVPTPAPTLPVPETVFFNGLGGFSPDGREYIIALNNKKATPAPWVNVLANPNFGTIISESGQSYTWSENAHEFRLTPWANDPVSDTCGEIFYLRDDETGHFWSPAPLPQGDQYGYIIRHGFGYSVFEHVEEGIHSEMWVYVDKDAPIKFISIKLKNLSGRSRKISVTGYIEWVLGELRTKSAMYTISEMDAATGALLARNPYNTEFAGRLAFFDTDDVNKSYTGDRAEFIGRNGTLQKPDAMSRVKLSGKLGAGLDPCAAIQVVCDLFDGQDREVVFKLGAGKTPEETIHLIQQFKGVDKAHEALQNVRDLWEHKVTSIQVETPDMAVNFLANGWLTYQVLSSRLWGRSGYYQSGGAYGFRDQLQDVLSLMHVEPVLARQQIMLCASRQYKEGDAQHWWHPPVGRGVRTRCSDDFLWLPFVTSRYVTHTGDTAVLNEAAPFLDGRLLNPDEETYYELPGHSDLRTSLYDHCVRAISHGLSFGIHGLPLMGTGDWNDGMDNVGRHGKGESVWLAFFLYDILIRFAPIATTQGDTTFAAHCLQEAEKLKANIDANAWDGEWYRRAYFDDGTPLGTATDAECQIDSIAQSWSVLSDGGSTIRSNQAMESAYERLVKKDDRLIQLLTPAFDKSALNPGYIKGYVPGVRENGGQYTHSAVWLTLAFAKLGDTQRTWELLNMINPINHGRTAEDIAIYKVEPYVIAADVYSMPGRNGQGGWTWYTGSAGWMSQLITESFLGLRQERNKLRFTPCIPAEWESYVIHYRFGNTIYHITFSQKQSLGDMSVTADGMVQQDKTVTMVDDGIGHVVAVTLFTKQSK